MDFVVWIIVIACIVSAVNRKGKKQAKRPPQAPSGSTQPIRRQQPGGQEVSGAGAQLLSQAMNAAVTSAAAGGAAWAKKLAEAMREDDFEEPPEVKAEPGHSHQGVHQPLEDSGEGGFSPQSQWIERRVEPAEAVSPEMADPCRATASRAADPCRAAIPVAGKAGRRPGALGLEGGENLLSAHRATRRSGSVSQMRQGQGVLTVDSQALRQGILWSEILNRRGGRRSIH